MQHYRFSSIALDMFVTKVKVHYYNKEMTLRGKVLDRVPRQPVHEISITFKILEKQLIKQHTINKVERIRKL